MDAPNPAIANDADRQAIPAPSRTETPAGSESASQPDIHDLYTRSGRLLQRSGNRLYSRAGHYLGQLANGKVFDPDGRYCGTLVGDRVVYRTVDSAAASTASTAQPVPASNHANHHGASLWGIEPPFTDQPHTA